MATRTDGRISIELKTRWGQNIWGSVPVEGCIFFGASIRAWLRQWCGYWRRTMSKRITGRLQPNLMHCTRFGVVRPTAAWAAIIFLGSFASIVGAADVPSPAPDVGLQAKKATTTSEAREREKREKWRRQMVRTPRPGKGCFQADYPDTRWHEMPCGKSNGKLYLPSPGKTTRLDQVGGSGQDFTAVVTGQISQAEGSFDSASVTSESNSFGTANAYSLQLNTNKMPTTSACNNAPDKANCQGWEQFVYDSSGSTQIQYWLINWGAPGSQCPTPRGASCAQGSASGDGWCPQTVTGFTDVLCVVDAASPPTASSEPATSLTQLTVTGIAGAGSTADSMVMSVGGHATTGSGGNYFPDLGNLWTSAEFNVFGDSGGDQAVFNTGASAQVRTAVTSGTTTGPGCIIQSTTAESNNMTLSNTAPAAVKGSAPALLFSEINPAVGAAATCAAATSVGDTHLTTVDGLYYDFQASGDFVLAQTEEGFRVEARQVSGAPTWPNATVNKAVAAQMGNTRVAVCTAPSRLSVDGTVTTIADGKALSLPSGANILHSGNVYLIVDQSGNSLRAEDNGSYVNVTVGLGRWPQAIQGILTNVTGHVNEIAARGGQTLTAPFVLADLYHPYADSWRVAPKATLLSACSERAAEAGIPSKPFYAKDLDPQTFRRTRAVCTRAGVKGKALLDSCTLDVAVIGEDSAAKVFVGARVPAAVGLVVPKRGSQGSHHDDSDDKDKYRGKGKD